MLEFLELLQPHVASGDVGAARQTEPGKEGEKKGVLQFDTLNNACLSHPYPLTRTIPARTSIAPTKKLSSIGSSSNTAPNVTPKSGVINEKTPSLDAK